MIGSIYSDIDLNSIFNTFTANLIQLYNSNCPSIKVKEHTKQNKPWLYSSLIKCINKTNKMYKKIIKHRTTEKCNYYKKYTNILTSVYIL